MTYLDKYRLLESVEAIKQTAIEDTKVAIFIGNNPDRIKAIEDAVNQAIGERRTDEHTD